jgi:hypothetical protein
LNLNRRTSNFNLDPEVKGKLSVLPTGSGMGTVRGIKWDLDEVVEMAVYETVLKFPALWPGSDRHTSSIAQCYEWIGCPADGWTTALARPTRTSLIFRAMETILKSAPL